MPIKRKEFVDLRGNASLRRRAGNKIVISAIEINVLGFLRIFCRGIKKAFLAKSSLKLITSYSDIIGY